MVSSEWPATKSTSGRATWSTQLGQGAAQARVSLVRPPGSGPAAGAAIQARAGSRLAGSRPGGGPRSPGASPARTPSRCAASSRARPTAPAAPPDGSRTGRRVRDRPGAGRWRRRRPRSAKASGRTRRTAWNRVSARLGHGGGHRDRIQSVALLQVGQGPGQVAGPPAGGGQFRRGGRVGQDDIEPTHGGFRLPNGDHRNGTMRSKSPVKASGARCRPFEAGVASDLEGGNAESVPVAAAAGAGSRWRTKKDPPLPESLWCPGGDSNSHEVTPTTT